MKQLNYREITKENLTAICKLSDTLTEGQKECVAPNVYSIAQGSVHSYAYYRGIYLDDTPIGFFMLVVPNEETKRTGEENTFQLWRFMISYEYQNKHYGSQVLDYIIEFGKKLGHTSLRTSCEMGEVSPYEFYLKYGFVDTGEVDHGEQILIYTFE
ncbi:GNAT family N-acetyltransferase [Candidatus Izemoplasma sp. B36]|uniref:GNAT family N-acetyltransferase n=1 Tax=Candidatus Izemoplasma sp. B36 TaxID=3242468 RepID=UPI0035565715